jgi:hypothetical protein
MKTLGIVGGIGPESTVDYYRSLIQIWREQTKDGSAPSIIVNSIDLKKMLNLIAAKAMSEVTDYLSEEMQRLARAGADVGLFAANTPHIVFDDLQRRRVRRRKSSDCAASASLVSDSQCKDNFIPMSFLRQGSLWPSLMKRSKDTFTTSTWMN